MIFVNELYEFTDFQGYNITSLHLFEDLLRMILLKKCIKSILRSSNDDATKNRFRFTKYMLEIYSINVCSKSISLKLSDHAMMN